MVLGINISKMWDGKSYEKLTVDNRIRKGTIHGTLVSVALLYDLFDPLEREGLFFEASRLRSSLFCRETMRSNLLKKNRGRIVIFLLL